MSDEYRDPLGAAHSRIAELEEKIATLEAEKSASKRFPVTGRFPQLEAKIERLELRADDKLNAQRRLWLTYISILFPLASTVFSFMHLPIAATIASVLFIGLIVVNLRNAQRQKADKILLAEAQKELADAHRIADLETRLAATEQRVRVDDAAATAEPLSASESDEPARTALRS